MPIPSWQKYLEGNGMQLNSPLKRQKEEKLHIVPRWNFHRTAQHALIFSANRSTVLSPQVEFDFNIRISQQFYMSQKISASCYCVGKDSFLQNLPVFNISRSLLYCIFTSWSGVIIKSLRVLGMFIHMPVS